MTVGELGVAGSPRDEECDAMQGIQESVSKPVAAVPASARKIVRLLRPSSKSLPAEPWRRLGYTFDPFDPQPDPARFFVTPAAHRLHKSLLAALQLGDGGLFLVTGEAGVGKTMLLGVLETALQVAGEQVAFHADGDDAAGQWLDALDRIAGQTPEEAGHAILLVDGADRWDSATVGRLEQFYETHGNRARSIRLVVAGRPEMEQKLQHLIARVLGTKTTFTRLRLDRLDEDCVGDFILNRLAQAGCQDTGPFAPAVLERIARESGGVPRRILELCATELGPTLPPPASLASENQPLPGSAALTDLSVAAPPARSRSPAVIPVAAAALVALAAAGGWATWRLLAAGDNPVTIAALRPEPSTPTAPSIPPEAVTAEVPQPPAVAPAAATVPAVVPPTAVTPPAPESTKMPATADTARPTPAPFKPADFMVSELGAISPAAGAFQAMTPKQKPALAPNPPVIDLNVKPSAGDIAAVLARVPKVDGRSAPAVAAPPASTPMGSASVASSQPAPASAGRQGAREDVPALMSRGDAYLAAGDLASARLFYERAADAGNADAALMVGQTFDPTVLAQSGLRGVRGDSATAATWYRRAAALGAPEAARLLGGLKAR